MDLKYKIVEVTPENITDHPRAVCFIKREKVQCRRKAEWYREHYQEASGMHGVAVVTSDKSFMCKKEIFLKNGYEKLLPLTESIILFIRERYLPADTFQQPDSEIF